MQNQQINKLKGLIGIANKAGYVIFGADNLKNYTKKLYLLVKAKETGNSITKIVNNLKNERSVDFVEIENQKLCEITNSQNCKLIGIKNKGLSEEILKVIRGENIG